MANRVVATFRFAPDILRRLGEELNPSLEHSVVELVKNSRDADAQHCEVRLEEVTVQGGTIRVSDDGDGMTAEELVDCFLLLGRSSKVGQGLTRRGRVLTGSKGLGRLAALRAGRRAFIRSRPNSNPDLEHLLILDWSKFENVDAVEDVDIEIKTRKRDFGAQDGTDIEISELTGRLGRREVRRLARALLLLADPFGDGPSGFQTKLHAQEFDDLEELVQKKYFTDAEYWLTARVDEGGWVNANVLDWRGETLFQAQHDSIRPSGEPYTCPEAQFELWAFILDSQTFETRNATLGEVRKWLTEFGGVMLYVNGIRVPPYGDPGNDWLRLDLRRVQSPELRPSTNTAIGRVRVDNDRGAFVEKTDRSGVIENDAFGDLRRMAIDTLNWMARERLRMREARRQNKRAESKPIDRGHREAVQSQIEQLAKDFPPGEEVVSLFKDYADAQERVQRSMRDEVQLYRTLSTAGIAAATFAHEYAAGPLKVIGRSISTLKRRLKDVFKPLPARIAKPIGLVASSTTTLETFTDGTLNLVDRDKRRVGRIDLHDTIKRVSDAYTPFIEEANASLLLDLCDSDPYLQSSVAAIESIVVNLLTNALYAVSQSKELFPTIRIATDATNEHFTLKISDNGLGVSQFSTDDIWLPGVTSRPGGSGLGLTIVKDTVVDLGGAVHAIASGPHGGATFEVKLPILGR